MAKYATASVEGFVDYHEQRGKIVPATWEDSTIEAALLVASEWIDGIYGSSFIGEKADGYPQEREWPRINAVIENYKYTYVVPSSEIPTKVLQAVYEAAFRQAQSPGSLLVDYTPGKYNSVSVDGAVSVDYRHFTFASDAQTSFPIIDQLLFDYLNSWGNVSSYSGPAIRV